MRHCYEHEYNENGKIIKDMHDCWAINGYYYEYEYDTNGNMIKDTTCYASGRIDNVTEYEYDSYGNRIKGWGSVPSSTLGIITMFECKYDADRDMITKFSYDIDINVGQYTKSIVEYQFFPNAPKKTIGSTN